MSCQRMMIAALALLVLAACGDDDSGTDDSGTDTSSPDTTMTLRCGGAGDGDGDFISTADEGDGDADLDGLVNDQDTDADGDGLLDVDEAGDMDCTTPPRDTDLDGIPDFLDTDGNGDGVHDGEQTETDLDGDGTPDHLDTDVDGDGIPNVDEAGDDPTLDTDGDGTPNVFDTDSDGDTILDVHEGRGDPDGDDIPNYLDLDSDDDGIDDATEAGDGDPATPPVRCAEEIDPITELPAADGLDDFEDRDSDNDGAPDGTELEFGTDPCNIDTDGDGFRDVVEIAYEELNCVDGVGEGCDCATLPSCGIPDDDFFVVLPFNADPVQRDLIFGTEVRVADIFFLTDTTGSMGSELNFVKTTVSSPGTGMIDRIRETIPDSWFAGAQHDDFPFGSYGSSRDQPLILAIGMTPPDRASEVQAAFMGMDLHSGADGPESSTEALYQTMTGEGGTWMHSGGSYTMRRYVGDCLDTGWGAPCFREGSLPIVIHFTDFCSHNGPIGESASCGDYTGITPSPAVFSDAMLEMNRRGAKYIGINTSTTSCVGAVGPDGRSPCFFMKRVAEESGSIDLEGNALVYDLPDGGGSSAAFIDAVVGAVETVATRVPQDVDTALRDDPTDTEGVDATQFIKRRQPACRATPPTDPCWAPPADVTLEDAVAAVDESTFFGVVPGTQVTFRITFQNDFLGDNRDTLLFIAFIDVRGSGAAVLDTRQVFIIVPATSGGGIG